MWFLGYAKSGLPHVLQFLVDISTPASVLDRLSEALKSHMDREAAEFKSDSALVSFTGVGDPLKVQLLVCLDYSHNGKTLSNNFPACCIYMTVDS